MRSAPRCRGGGGVVVLEAPAGLGKTVLLEHARVLADDAGLLVRRAAPGPLERHFPFGVVRALLEAPVREHPRRARPPARRRRPPSPGELLLDGGAPAGDSSRC